MNLTLGILLAICLVLAMAQFILLHRLKSAESRLDMRESEHRATTDRLLESENRLRAIIEHEPECVKLQAADGTVLDVNPAGLALIDCERREDFVGTSIYDSIIPEFRDLYRQQMAKVFSGESTVFEFKARSLKGRECWMETHAVPLRDARNQIYAFLGVTRDITEHKMIEEQTRRHQIELARVARLSSMGEMATGIAHELNQPLSAIANFARGCVRRLKNGGADPAEFIITLDEIATQAERAAEVIRHVRDFTRKSEPQLSRLDINALVRSISRFTELEIRPHGAELDLDLASALPIVEADGIMIEQVLCNLVRNAAEAMSGSGCVQPVVKVQTRPSIEGGVEVAVMDRGPGLTASDNERIFDQFYTTKPDGMGIGLAISRSIIESHGGNITAGNQENGGAIFSFRLPPALAIAA